MARKFTLVYKEPVIGNNNELGQLELSPFQFNMNTEIGYDSASIPAEIKDNQIGDWMQNGLMRDIEVYDHSLTKIFEGFVNQIKIQVGPLSVVVGPIIEIANKVAIVYQTTTYNTIPPVGGDRVVSAFAEDADSQGRYGTFETYISGGTGDTTEMEQARDTYLAEYKEPETTYSLSFGSLTTPQLTLEILGYGHLLKRYHFSDVSGTGKQNASLRIQDVLGSDPDSIFSSDYSDIAANTLQLGVFDDDEKTGDGVIKDVVSYGDASDNRYTFGIFNDRKAFYGPIPTSIEYEHYLFDREQRITLDEGPRVFPWNVRPGKWLFLADFLIGGPKPTTLAQMKKDPRCVFIESVAYTAPWGLNINGGKVYTIAQKLAKMGLGG